MSNRSELGNIAFVAQLLAVLATVAALYFGRDVLIPLTLAILLSFLLSPAVDRLQRMGISNVLAVITTAFFTFVLLAGGLTLLGRELTKLVSELPQYKEELVGKARSLAGMRSGMRDSLDELAEEVSRAMEESGEAASGERKKRNAELAAESTELQRANDSADTAAGSQSPARRSPDSQSSDIRSVSPLQQLTDRFLSRIESPEQDAKNDGASPKTPLYTTEVPGGVPFLSWASTAGSVLGPLGTAGLVTVFALFLLVHRQDLRDRIIAVISQGNYVMTTEALTEVAKRISRYLIAQMILNTSYGVILSIGLFIIGRTLAPEGTFPNVILWGVLAACFRFVPYAGPIVGAIFPLAFSLTVFPGFTVLGSVLGLIIVMELLSNNIFEPWLYGASTGISTVAVIFSAVFWGWLWGPVGLLLSTPLTVCLVVLGRHVSRFQVFATLLGEEIVVKPSVRFYQRLLAKDEHQATKMLEMFQAQKGTIVTCDEVIIPTIKRLRNDRKHGELNAADSVELLEDMHRCIKAVDWTSVEAAPPTRGASATNSSHGNRSGTGSGIQNTMPSSTGLELQNPNSPSAAEYDLPRIFGISAHHFSDDILLQLLHDSLTEIAVLEVIDDSELPETVAKRVFQEDPAIVVLAQVPPGGFIQVRAMCRSLRDGGYAGPILVTCIGNFKNFDRIAIKFRSSGATYISNTFKQSHAKLRALLLRNGRVLPVASAAANLIRR